METSRQLIGFVGVAVGNVQTGGVCCQQGSYGTACSTASTEQENAPAGEGAAEIVLQIGEQTRAVGVVAVDAAVGGEAEGVHRASLAGPVAEVSAQPVGFFLERNGDIGATTACGHEAAHAAGKIVEGRQNGPVAEILAGAGGKGTMDGRRAGVGDRVTENAVAVLHGVY